VKEAFLRANGLRIRYLDWEGAGADLLLVHPTGFVADIWTPIAERLRHRFHVLALDSRGHGDTDKPEASGIRLLIDDLGAFVSAAGLKRPVGIGHSAGATTIAGVEAAMPGRFSTAVLIEPVLDYNPSAGPRTLETDPLAAGTLKRRSVWPNRDAALKSYRSRPPFQHWDDAALRQYIEHGFADRTDGAVELKCAPESESRMYLRGPHTISAEGIIPHVGCPVLLVRGQDSMALTPATFERTSALLPDCRSMTLPGGHFTPFEHPDLAAQAALDFLGATVEGALWPQPALRETGS